MTINHEPADIETLDLQTAYRHSWNDKEYVRIGVPDEGFISLCLAQFNVNGQCVVVQAVLNDSEVDSIIEGLISAQLRLREQHDSQQATIESGGETGSAQEATSADS